MTITINGCPKEIAELTQMLTNGAKSERKPYFPPIFEEISEDDGKKTVDELNTFLGKLNKNAKHQKENAPHTETAERQENKVLSREEAKEVVKSIDTAVREALKCLCHTP